MCKIGLRTCLLPHHKLLLHLFGWFELVSRGETLTMRGGGGRAYCLSLAMDGFVSGQYWHDEGGRGCSQILTYEGCSGKCLHSVHSRRCSLVEWILCFNEYVQSNIFGLLLGSYFELTWESCIIRVFHAAERHLFCYKRVLAALRAPIFLGLLSAKKRCAPPDLRSFAAPFLMPTYKKIISEKSFALMSGNWGVHMAGE